MTKNAFFVQKMMCDRWPACGCGTQSGPHTCEGKEDHWPKTTKMLNEKIKTTRYFVENRNVDVLMMIARRLDHPSVFMGLPSHGNMRRAIEIYDMLFEE